MKLILRTKIIHAVVCLVLVGLLAAGCSNNMTPVDPNGSAPPAAPSPATPVPQEHKVTYNYGDTGPIQLSANNLVLTVGQKLILAPAPGLTKNTRFISSGENFFGDIMQQEGDTGTGQVVFVAKKAGKGKLQIIPNTNETSRATDLWVTVQ
ncbi:hypothetical protein [Sporomusa termitida]|uniref:Uncharacterized protein n=1 Tax=Sporomusa termitida TaxID=2377 RepID=A0A517DY92_9FIRM|nr:hypothetical protein [Sporomusa termitida]QDR82334.1 hypothetical protein SPTER_37590 [Sporomusa termitida]